LKINKPYIFLSSGLSSEQDRNRNEVIAARLQTLAEIYLPQRDGGLFVDLLKSGLSWKQAAAEIYNADMSALQSSDIVVAVLPKGFVGGGVCFELGAAIALRKMCWGLVMQDEERFKSPLIETAISKYFESLEDLEICLAQWKGP
jgi:nucleoside 2-deoxyribosyltransferase